MRGSRSRPGYARGGSGVSGRKLARVAGEQVTEPDHAAVRVALWRAPHVEVDAPPHVLEDEIGLRMSTGEDFLVATA
jgi:hypothetical protein